MGELNDINPHDPAGVVATACLQREMARNTGRLWTTTLISRASSSRMGMEGWRPSPKSAVYIIATRAWRRKARCMVDPGVMPGAGGVCAGKEKTPPFLPFTTPMESDQRLRLCRRDAADLDERFCRRIRRPTTFSVRTAGVRPAPAWNTTRDGPKFLCTRRPVVGRITRRGATESLFRRRGAAL